MTKRSRPDAPVARATLEMARFIHGIVRVVRAGDRGSWTLTVVRCRRRTKGKRCKGDITGRWTTAQAPIEWKCPTCGDGGTISGWNKEPEGQLVHLADNTQGSDSIEVVFTDEENFEIERVLLLEPEFQRITLDARPVNEGVKFEATREDFDLFLEFVNREANPERLRVREARLKRIQGKLQQVPARQEVYKSSGSTISAGSSRSSRTSITYDKLIRDRIPEILKAKGKAFRTRVAGADEFGPYAVKKLQEELDEFKESGEIEELADLLEVIYAISGAHGVPPGELERLRAEKANERGGFDRRLILIEAD